MRLTREQIEAYIGQPQRKNDILVATTLQDEHKIHVTGEGYKDALKDAIGGRALDYGERELSKPSTKFLTKKIKDELSRWKNNQGTRKSYDFGEDEKAAIQFRKELQSVWKGGSIDEFASFINDALYTDFNGFALVERGRPISLTQEIKDGIPSKRNGVPYIIFVAIEDVVDYRLRGKKVEYLIINYPESEGRRRFRVLDDSADYIYVQTDEGYELDESENVIPNDVGYVPAIQISTVNATPLNDHVKTSHIDQTVPILQDYMTRHAEHVISELLHASPLLALKGQKCTYEVDGHKCSNGKIWLGGDESTCPQCNGVGATVPKNSSEVIIVPDLDAKGNTYNPSMVGQYIVPPTSILDHQAKELDDMEKRAVYSGTGIRMMVKESIQTATETILNIKPLEDKISSLLDNIEAIESFITDTIGRMRYREKYKGSNIKYGRRLNVREENAILNEIEQSKRAGLPVSEIRLLYNELIVTRYRNSPVELERAQILFELEPLATSSTKEIIESEYVDDSTKRLKQNFDDYIDRFELEHGPVHLYMAESEMSKRLKKMRKILLNYNDTSQEDREGA